MLAHSTRKDKKLMIELKDGRKIHFGQRGSQTYVEGASDAKREAYIARHRIREDWSTINPGSASRFILWGESRDLETNLRSFLKSMAHDKRCHQN